MKPWLRPKMMVLRRERAEIGILHRTEVPLLPGDGCRHVSAQGVTAPRIKVTDDATRELIERALKQKIVRE